MVQFPFREIDQITMYIRVQRSHQRTTASQAKPGKSQEDDAVGSKEACSNLDNMRYTV